MHLKTSIIAALAGTSLALDLPLSSRKDFECPKSMAYSPWTKACSCPPGQIYDPKKKSCKGPKVKGPWPKPSIDDFSVSQDGLAAFCAKTPTRIVEYDEQHEYCQASVSTLTFSGTKDVLDELKGWSGKDIEVADGDLSPEMKNICAGLSGLYLEDASDAVELFNTPKFGLDTLLTDVIGSLPRGLLDLIGSVTCLIGLGKHCEMDCVSWCVSGCGNFLDDLIGEDGLVGGLLEDLNGLCILDGVLEGVGGLTCGIDDLLCTVGNIVEGLLGLFDCACDGDDGDDNQDDEDDHCKEKCKRSTPGHSCPPECEKEGYPKPKVGRY